MLGDGIAEAADATREAAFRRLAEQHLDASYRLACAILGDPAEAQDATHDAFVQAWRKWSTLRDPARFEHWFDRILVNTCRNRLKRASRWRTQDLFDDLATAPGDPMGQTLDREVLGAALSRSCRPIIGSWSRCASTATSRSTRSRACWASRPGTVNSRLHYAMKRLA